MGQNVKQLVIMRHAKSSWDDELLTDYERPLNDRGRLAAPLMGRLLREHKINVDVVLASSAVRVRRNSVRLNSRVTSTGCRSILGKVAIHGLVESGYFISTIAGLHDQWQSVMLVGHNPGLSQLLSHFSNEPQRLPTAAIAILETVRPFAGPCRLPIALGSR